MLTRFLLFFILFIYFSFSQDLNYLDTDSLSNNDLYYVELNNIGDPILLLSPLEEEKDFILNHYSEKVRKIDIWNTFDINKRDSIYSHINYQGTYQDGGHIEAFLSRPLGRNMSCNFIYNNLSSVGYYINQHNKYSLIYFDLNYLNQNKTHSFYFSLFSRNGDYQQNGGIQENELNQSPELLPVYLDYAKTIVKNRELKFSHNYIMKSDLTLRHSIILNFYNRTYEDGNPVSYHYSLTPFNVSSSSNYQYENFLNKTLNSISLSNNNFNFRINHSYYNTDNIDMNNVGDIDLLFSGNKIFKSDNKLEFKLGFCPIGYNKNNYIFNFNLHKKIKQTMNILGFLIKAKKPNFLNHYHDDLFSFEWNSLRSINIIDLSLLTSFIKRNFFISTSIKRYSNYFFFNQLAFPEQIKGNIIYINFKVDKIWSWDHFFIKSTFLMQQSNNTILSVPLCLLSQDIKHKTKLFGKLDLVNSLSISVFSKYYMNSYFPLTDIFYLQNEEKTGFSPLISASTSINQDRFSIGFILDNMYQLIDNNIYFVKDYVLPPTSVRFFIKWGFLN